MNWDEIEAYRLSLMQKLGRFVGYNDPLLDHLIPKNHERPQGTADCADGFLFGGEIFPSVEAARRAHFPPKKERCN